MIIPPLIVLLVIFFRLLRKIFRISPDQIKNTHVALNIIFSILVLGLIFMGIRGRIQAKAPIKAGTAYFSDNPLLNQLGLNPVFTLMRSYLDSKDERNKSVEFMDDNQAIRNVRKYLKITQPVDGFPVARQIQPGEPVKNRYNVILVIMESMSASRMARHGNKNNLTPFLDSLSFKSYYFENIYTAGVHSFNGVFSTLFSFPAIYRQNPMKESSIFKYNGIGNVLKRNGYSTTCFTTLDGQFDNVEGFLRANDFENFISVSDYPSKEVRTALGVPDDFMFEFSMPVIDNLYKENKPFFITFLTASDHRPYYIPDYFKPKNSDITDQIVEYADWSLRKFITLASAKAWFDNTLFVFVADHGSWTNMVYDIPLDFFHTPLIFYGPEILKQPRTFDCIGGQIDVFPTIMGILNQKYINNTLGINLLSETRPYIFINFDNMLGVIDQEYLLILKADNENALYSYRNNDKKNYLSEKQQLVLDMKEYNFSNLQVFQYLMHSEKRYIDY
jgi:phosphoglycerol transferase MdoB-like AlkP superfamily enzyme